MRGISIFFTLIFMSFVCHFASSANEEKKCNSKDVMTNIMKINEKFDYLNEKVENLESNLPTGKNSREMDEIKINIKQIIEEQEKKNNTIEKHFNKFEEYFKKLDKIDEHVKKIDKIDKHVKKIDKIDEHLKKIDKIEKLLLEMFEKSDQLNASESKMDITSKMAAQCAFMCESEVMIWANETNKQFKDNLDKQEMRIKEDNSTTIISLKPFNLCDSNPCLNGGRCELTHTGSEYLCRNCPYPTSGTRCENVMCGANKCYQHKNTVYVLFELNGKWEQANRKCVSEGMTLAMPKDNESTEFLVNQLRPIFGYSVGKKYTFFWLGLSYSGSAKQWQWVNGSPLGGYTGGNASFKSNTGQYCGLLHLEGGGYLWSYYNCVTLSSSYPIYALCEKRISVS